MAAPSSCATLPSENASLPFAAPNRFGPIWSVPMQGESVSRPLFRNVRIAGVAKSTSHVTIPITAPLPIRLVAHEVETSGFEFCVSHVRIWSFRPSTPPRALIFFTSSWAAARAGLLNGDIWPLRSIAAPMMIGGPAAVRADVVPASAATTAATATSTAPPAVHLVLPLMLPPPGVAPIEQHCRIAPPTSPATGRPRFDAVIVGSGINSLVAGALLARGGWRVCVLEREDRLGGAIRTEELTEPGFVHEVFASWHPLFTGSAAYAQLRGELEARGVEYLNTELPTATLFPDGEAVFLTTSHEANVRTLGPGWERTVARFMPNADLAFGVLSTELWSTAGAALAAKAVRRLGRRGLVEFTGNMLSTCRDWARETFESDRPWGLHTGLGPDAASSGFMAQVIGVAIELGGMPVPRGGGIRLVEALAGIVRDGGGALETGRDVERVVLDGGRAAGVRVADGAVFEAERAVLANVTPQQLYERLLGGGGPVAEARRFRHGRGEMQIHLALSEPPRWAGDERLARTAIVHLSPGLDGVSRAVNEADRGLLPVEATIVCGQPCAVDPSRAPDGAWILWLQLQEVPSRPRGDAAGELDVGGGTWTEE